MRILVPLPDRDFDITEVSVPLRLLRDDGHSFTFATEAGGEPPAGDPRLLAGVLFSRLGAQPEAKRLYAQLAAAPEFRRPIAWEAIQSGDFDGLLLLRPLDELAPGGPPNTGDYRNCPLRPRSSPVSAHSNSVLMHLPALLQCRL